MRTQSMPDLLRGYERVLDQIGYRDALTSWRRAVAQYRTLQRFEQLVEEIKESQAGGGGRGATVINRAHNEYLKKTCPDASPDEPTRCKKKLDVNLRFARRWNILIQGPAKDGKPNICGLGEGIILAATPEVFRIINDKGETHASVQQLLHDIREDKIMLAVCQILQPAAQSLLQCHRLTADLDWASVLDRHIAGYS
ncbi:hypothetical protein TruAng_008389 [Truncatella angustata]|nr:hypothetical protein TruAng_008389 [Truncatella angustata]